MELDYAPNFKVPLFRCQWVKLTGGGVTVDKEYGMTTVDHLVSHLSKFDQVKFGQMKKQHFDPSIMDSK